MSPFKTLRLIVLTLSLSFILTGCFVGVDMTSPVTAPASGGVSSAAPANADDPPGGPGPADVIELAPEAAAAPAHALSIAALRERAYEGSDFVVEQVLEPGSNYNRYVVSYLSDGLKIYAMLTVPQAERPPTGFPVIIFNHGYIPPAEYRTTERYVAYVDAFARSGYIVVKPDYRGHGSSEGEAGNGYGSAGYVIDVLNATAAARRYLDSDPNRVGMWGHSMGGYITLRAMVANQNIRAGVIWAGVVASYDEMFRSWFDPTPRAGWRTDLVNQYGAPADNPAFWNTLSANSYLNDLSGPIQIHHGTGDATVPFAYSSQLDEQIRAAGQHTELFLWPGDDHNIATYRDDALTLSVVFFNQHVANIYE
jgi:dipeptidyl aminopeptidase/acylaminoacyl peptidase